MLRIILNIEIHQRGCSVNSSKEHVQYLSNVREFIYAYLSFQISGCTKP